MANNPTEPLSPGLRGWAYWLPLFSTLLLVAVAAKRIKTFVTAQDPYWYIGLAHSILGGRSDPAEFAHGLSYISPGFPLLLAGAIKLFGDFAPYALNPLLAVGFLLLYAELIRHLFPSRASILIFLPGTLFLLVHGYALNIHFLLYPFRGMAIYFLSVLGMYLLYVRAEPSAKPTGYILAGSPFALAVAIREPALLAVVGTAAWILLHGGIRNPSSWKRLGWFLLPMMLGGAAVAAVVLAQGRGVNNQLESWVSIVSGKNIPAVLGTARIMGGFLIESIHLPGLILAGIGAWTCRRNTAVLCFFLLPAIGFFLFYSLYMPHYRYLLTVVVFAAPLVCAGVLWGVDAVDRYWPRLHAHALAAGLLVATTGLAVASMEPWGHKVTSGHIKAFQESLAELAPSGGVAFVDPRCRYLVDALVCYSDLAVLSPTRVRAQLAAGQRCFHFKPLDVHAYYDGYVDRTLDPLGMAPDYVLPFYVDQRPVRNPDGTPRVVAIANGHFAIEEVFTWEQKVVREKAVLPGNQGHTLWLDFGEQAPEAVAEVHLEDRDGVVLASWPSIPARHLQGVYAPVSQTGSGLRVLEIRSDDTLPGKILRGVRSNDQSMHFSLGAQRSPSTHYWMHPPFGPAEVSAAKIGYLHPAGRLSLPVPIGAEAQVVDGLLMLETAPGTPDQRLQVEGPAGNTTQWTISPPQSYVQVLLQPPHTSSQASIGLELSADKRPPGSRIGDIAIRIRGADPLD